MATPSNQKALQVAVNPAARQVQVIMLSGGMPIADGAIVFTPEQAEDHVRAVQTAIAAIRQAKPTILLPPGVGRSYQP